MKDEAHHLKHVQKKVLRSVKQESFKTLKKNKAKRRVASNDEDQVVVYDEIISSDQQVLRAPTRPTYH